MKITIKTPEEIELLRNAATLVSRTLAEVGKRLRPGVNTLELDTIAETFIRDHGGVPAFKNYKPSFSRTPYPFTLCMSVNDEVVHGFPSQERVLQAGDILAADCGVMMDGYYGDSAYTFAVGEVKPEVRQLLDTTYEALDIGLEHATHGTRLGTLSNAIQAHVEDKGYGIVRDMVGHGIGRNIHEPPEVPNFGRKGTGLRLKAGMVLCIEPMINLGAGSIYTEDDGWTIRSTDHSPSVHYERMVAVGKTEADILTPYDIIEQELKTVSA